MYESKWYLTYCAAWATNIEFMVRIEKTMTSGGGRITTTSATGIIAIQSTIESTKQKLRSSDTY
jgi:hypothetical protein